VTDPDDRPVEDDDTAVPVEDLPIEADEADAMEQTLDVPDEGEDDYR